MKITSKSLLKPVNGKKVEGKKKYVDIDTKYTIAAIPITTSKFGPSGSLKNENIARENKMDVRPRVTNDIVFILCP